MLGLTCVHYIICSQNGNKGSKYMKKIKIKDLMSTYGEYTISDELIEKLEPPEATTVWDLPNGDTCYYIDVEGDVILSAWYESCRGERDIGNVFLTQEDAESDVERRKVETLLLRHGGRRWFKKAPLKNFYIWLHKGRVIVSADSCPAQGTIYFDSREQAEKAIAEIGETYIKNILFEVR